METKEKLISKTLEEYSTKLIVLDYENRIAGLKNAIKYLALKSNITAAVIKVLVNTMDEMGEVDSNYRTVEFEEKLDWVDTKFTTFTEKYRNTRMNNEILKDQLEATKRSLKTILHEE